MMFESATHIAKVAYVFKEDNYDIDLIIGVQNIRIQDPATLGELALERLGHDFRRRIKAGVFLVGGRNFGYGHPHVQALIAIRHLGVAGIVADSFTPALWRGAIATGFPVVSCPGIADAIEAGDTMMIDWKSAELSVQRTGVTMAFKPHTPFERRQLEAGGIVPLLSSGPST